MRIIQSFWTKPFLDRKGTGEGNRWNGGWPHRKLNYFSWALSCLSLRTYYEEVELVTDDKGKEILIDKMQLPYTKTTTTLNVLGDRDGGLWALGKVYAYGLQKTPFLHVDNDIFIGKPFSRRIARAGLAAQNVQLRTPHYSAAFREVTGSFEHIPGYLAALSGHEIVPCSNAGILGGRDIGFFQTYMREVLAFLDKNAGNVDSSLRKMDAGYFNVIYEQVLFYALAGSMGKDITYLFDRAYDIPPQIGFFHAAKKNGLFVHCFGSYKKFPVVYLFMEEMLKQRFPKYYDRIENLIATFEL